LAALAGASQAAVRALPCRAFTRCRAAWRARLSPACRERSPPTAWAEGFPVAGLALGMRDDSRPPAAV